MARPRSKAKPEEVGLSSERLTRIHTAIQRHIDAGDISGAVTLVGRKGRLAHLEAQGVMDLASKKPMATDTIFHLASMTKPIAGVAILMLMEEGKLRLTDPVSKYIPELKSLTVAVPMEPGPGPAAGRGAEPKFYTVPAAREITIRDLLTHTSGLVSGGISATEAAKMPRKPTDSLADYIPRLAAVPLAFQPGSRWTYSPGAGFDTLGRVVEVISGQTFDAFLRQRIFEPLGMKDTFFYPPDDRLPRVATIYQRTPEGLQKAPDQRVTPEQVLFGRRRPDEHRRRLSAVRTDARQRRPVEREAAAQSDDGRVDVVDPRERHLPGPAGRAQLGPLGAGDFGSESRRPCACRRAASDGTARSARTSGRIPRKRWSVC